MPQHKDEKRKRGTEEIAFWQDVAVRLMSDSEHWREFYHKRQQLRRAKERGILTTADIEMLELDLMEMCN